MWCVDNDDEDNDDDDDEKEDDDDEEDEDDSNDGDGGGNYYLLKSCHFFLFWASWVIVFQSFHAVFNSWRTDFLQFAWVPLLPSALGLGRNLKQL